MVPSKPKIWVKSYPFPKEVTALADLGAQDIGMEIFLGSSAEKNEECLKLCRDHYPRVGVELFVYQDKGKGDVIYDPLSMDRTLRELSRGYLFRALYLAIKYGATHLQLDGNDGFKKLGQAISSEDIREAIERKKGLLAEIKKQYDGLPIYFENTVPIADNASELVFSLTCHRLSDFWKEGLPLEYDPAHHAIALDVYSRASEFNFLLTAEEDYLAQRVRDVGITRVLLDDLDNISEIYFTHLGNASKFTPRTKCDVIPQEPEKALVDLERVLPVLMEKSRNITPEVADKDYVQRPNLRAWISRLQSMGGENDVYFKR